MKKLVDIEKELDRKGVDHWRSMNGQKIIIKACTISDSASYEYYEEEPPICLSEEWQFLVDDPRIDFMRCCDCCACGSW